MPSLGEDPGGAEDTAEKAAMPWMAQQVGKVVLIYSGVLGLAFIFYRSQS